MELNAAQKKLLYTADEQIASIRASIERLSNELNEWQVARRQILGSQPMTNIEKAKVIAEKITIGPQDNVSREEQIAIAIDTFLDNVGGIATARQIFEGTNLGIRYERLYFYLRELKYTVKGKNRYAKWTYRNTTPNEVVS